MKSLLNLTVLFVFLHGNLNFADPSEIKPDLISLSKNVINRSGTVVEENSLRFLRMSEDSGQGLLWIPDVKFSTGRIEVQVRGKDVFQKSFVGIAFLGADNTKYEAVYLRPFNFQSKDPVRHSHAIQYVAHPDFTWQKLRSDRPEEFEKSVRDGLNPNDWVDLKLIVTADRVQGFAGDMNKPALDVPRLSTVKEGLVGLWVGDGSGGDFMNLRIEPSAAGN